MKLRSDVHRPLARSLIVAAFVAGAAWLPTGSALACKCAPPPEAEAAKADATAVFEGRVTTIADAADQPGEKRVTLSVVRVWKGLANEEQVVVRTRAETAACGYPFEAGASYLVYAGGDTLALSVHHCGRTRPLAEADTDLHALGAGITPVSVRSDAGAKSVGDTEAGVPSTDAAVGPSASATAGSSGGCATGRTGSKGALLWLGLPALSLLKRRRKVG